MGEKGKAAEKGEGVSGEWWSAERVQDEGVKKREG